MCAVVDDIISAMATILFGGAHVVTVHEKMEQSLMVLNLYMHNVSAPGTPLSASSHSVNDNAVCVVPPRDTRAWSAHLLALFLRASATHFRLESARQSGDLK
jgi:hypothetical protein